MKIINRYLGITVINSTLVVLLILMGLAVFVALVKEIGNIGTGAYGLIGALEYVAFDMPRQIYNFFPIAALIGVLLGLSILANHSELIVLRANGVSIAGITRSVLRTSLFLLICATIIGEWLAPMAAHDAESRKASLISGGQALLTGRGMWVRDGLNVINIQRVFGSKHIQDINLYVFDQQRDLVQVSHAESGHYEHSHWVMQNVATSFIKQKQVHSKKTATETWNLTLSPDLLHISEIDPDQMTLLQLHNYINYLKKNNLNYSSYALSFWQRLLQPFSTLIMVWLAIPFVFGSLRSMTMGVRIVLGVVVGFTFFILNRFFGPFSIVYQWPPFWAAATPVILFALAALALQSRVK